MVNAAYFKGNWASKFNSEETQRKPFYVKRDVIRNVEFMKQKGRFNYYPSELLRAHVLQMPYQGEDISMIIILPPFEDDSLYTTVQKMTPETIQGIIKTQFTYNATNLSGRISQNLSKLYYAPCTSFSP